MNSPHFTYQFYNTTTLAWEGMYQAILAAKKSIFWEVYIFVDDKAGARFIDALCEKAKVGVEVKIVIDSIGSFSLSKNAEARLVAAGIKVKHYNPLLLSFNFGNWMKRIWMRNHRKILIIDEEVAFLGGVNVDVSSASWDDLHVRLTGKVVRLLLKGFARSYVRAGGAKKEVRALLHPKLTFELNEWKEKIRFILHSPYKRRKAALSDLYGRAISAAKQSVTLLTPYYAPDKKLLALIRAAKARGVEINILIPGKSDHWFMQYMAEAYLDITERAGAVVYFLKKMNHGKALSIDDTMAMVGSVNLIPSSFFNNEESGVYFQNTSMIQDLNHILDDWKKDATPWSVVRMKSKTWYRRILTRIVMMFHNYV